jgi:hypothetical protein
VDLLQQLKLNRQEYGTIACEKKQPEKKEAEGKLYNFLHL